MHASLRLLSGGYALHPSLPAGLADGLAPKDWRYTAAFAATRPEAAGWAASVVPPPSRSGPGKLGGVKRGILANC